MLESEIEALKATFTNDVPENCEGILGYETNALGDGVWGSYFDNEDFYGNAIKEADLNIDYEWNG